MALLEDFMRRQACSYLEARVALKLAEFDGRQFQAHPTGQQMSKETNYVARACTLITLVHTLDSHGAQGLPKLAGEPPDAPR